MRRIDMTIPPETRRRLDAGLDRLEREQVVVLELTSLEHLLAVPIDPLAATTRPGIDEVAATLTAARNLPEHVTVRVELAAGSATEAEVADMTVAFHRRATDMAMAAWRDAMTVRSMGRHQLPVGIVIAVVSALVAYGAAALATTVDNALVIGAVFVFAGLAITVAWVVSWIVVETSMLDWREDGRTAAAYELLSTATLEVTDGAG